MSSVARLAALTRRRVMRALLVVGALGVGALLVGAGIHVVREAPASDALPEVNAAASGILEAQSGEERSVVALPEHRNGRLAVYLHGHGQPPGAILHTGKIAGITAALLRQGYVVAAASGGGNLWGDTDQLSVYRGFVDRLKARYGLHSVYYMAESMGGLAVQQLAATDPEARAVAEFYPVYDASTLTSPGLVNSLRAAWAGAAISRVEPVAVASRLPLRVWASAGDTIVPMSSNAARLVARARALGDDARLVRTRGDHGDPSNFDPAAILTFFDAH